MLRSSFFIRSARNSALLRPVSCVSSRLVHSGAANASRPHSMQDPVSSKAATDTENGVPMDHLAQQQFTSKMHFIDSMATLQTYRVMDPHGHLVDSQAHPPADVSIEQTKHLYRLMLTLNVMDKIMYEAQRQGRFSFYMTHFGEEALLGVVAALKSRDVIHGQYREAFGLLYRGFSVEDCMNQCFANAGDGGKGRQMPVHYTSSQHYFQSISSPLATQIPQAAGSAYALKLRRATKYHPVDDEQNCSVCFFGEGAASEGDFHAGMNMAATLKCPVIFVCRNNGYAISTPASEQYNGDGIASRGVGYGMDTIRIDGNDLWAAYNATKTARKIAVAENRPVLIEAMTYRVGHHSTSDDSTKYRDRKEVEHHQQLDNPITRLSNYMMHQGFWTQAEDEALRKDVREHVMASFKRAENRKKPPVSEVFTDVYDTLPPHLQQQEAELKRLIATYPEYYAFADEHEPSAPK